MTRKEAQQHNATRKKAMIEALEKSLGIVTIAAKMAGIDRVTHYRWYDKDSKYKAAVDSVSDMALDMAESSLHQQIKDNVPASTIFYLKTKGKKRGYIEKNETDLNVTSPINLIFKQVEGNEPIPE